MNEKYKDIIGMAHHVSTHHKPMPMINRAAQFAPFAALPNLDAAIDNMAQRHKATTAETARKSDCQQQ